MSPGLWETAIGIFFTFFCFGVFWHLIGQMINLCPVRGDVKLDVNTLPHTAYEMNIYVIMWCIGTFLQMGVGQGLP